MYNADSNGEVLCAPLPRGCQVLRALRRLLLWLLCRTLGGAPAVSACRAARRAGRASTTGRYPCSLRYLAA